MNPRCSPWERFPNVLRNQDFFEEHLRALFRETDRMIQARNQSEGYRFRQKRTLLTLFYEASSRTETTFLRAAQNLGMDTIAVRDPARLSSEVKGESFEDAIRTYGGPKKDDAYRIADIIVLRHEEEDRPERAASVSAVPIINAGNGSDQHPTQSFVDVYAIEKIVGRLDNLHVGIVGDLRHGRTCRSLAYLLPKVGTGIRFTFISHPDLQMGRDVCDYLRQHGIRFDVHAEYGNVLPELDLLYVTRLQKERDPEKLRALAPALAPLRLTPERLEALRPEARVFHPLPIDSSVPELSEMTPELCAQARARDRDPRLVWFDQCDYGVPVRMALLSLIFGA